MTGRGDASVARRRTGGSHGFGRRDFTIAASRIAVNRRCLGGFRGPDMRLSARNQIAGTIQTVKPGAMTSYVTIEIAAA
jgi:hypothetical protein